MQCDFAIISAGFAGSVVAERLASQAEKTVLLIDKRSYIGVNAYDCLNEAGILIHQYGPHIFHTNSTDVFAYLLQFTEWRPYKHRVLASVEEQLLPIPINLDTVNNLYGYTFTSEELAEYFKTVGEPVDDIRTSENVVVSQVGRDLYEKFFRGYTRKQWGVDPSELDKMVTSRISTRTNQDDRYFTDEFQYMPLHGYTKMVEKMVDHPTIYLMLSTDFKQVKDQLFFDELIYTGPVDAYFNCCYGKLPYRSLRFDHQTLDEADYQAVWVVNFPKDQTYTRSTKYKKLTGQEYPKTSFTFEYPQEEGDPYYPIPRPENADLYRRYKHLADQQTGVHFVGRWGTYWYYNRDQVVTQVLTLYKKVVGAESPHVVQ